MLATIKIKRTDSRWLNVYPPKLSNRFYTRQFEKAPLVHQKKTSKVSISPPWTIELDAQKKMHLMCTTARNEAIFLHIALQCHAIVSIFSTKQCAL